MHKDGAIPKIRAPGGDPHWEHTRRRGVLPCNNRTQKNLCSSVVPRERKQREREAWCLEIPFCAIVYTTGNNVPSPNSDIFWQIVSVMTSF